MTQFTKHAFQRVGRQTIAGEQNTTPAHRPAMRRNRPSGEGVEIRRARVIEQPPPGTTDDEPRLFKIQFQVRERADEGDADTPEHDRRYRFVDAEPEEVAWCFNDTRDRLENGTSIYVTLDPDDPDSEGHWMMLVWTCDD